MPYESLYMRRVALASREILWCEGIFSRIRPLNEKMETVGHRLLNLLSEIMAASGHLYAEPIKKITVCSTIGVKT